MPLLFQCVIFEEVFTQCKLVLYFISVSTLNTEFNRNPSSRTMLPTPKFLTYIFTSCTGCKFFWQQN